MSSLVDVFLERIAYDEEACEARRAPIRAEERVVERNIAVWHEAQRWCRQRVRLCRICGLGQCVHTQRGEERGIVWGEDGVEDGYRVGRLWERKKYWLPVTAETQRARGEDGDLRR